MYVFAQPKPVLIIPVKNQWRSWLFHPHTSQPLLTEPVDMDGAIVSFCSIFVIFISF